MASLQKQYDDVKLDGRIYTPSFIVDKMLDEIGYNDESILGKKIIDPACGDGRFLSEIVRRIVKFSDEENIVANLKCVYGNDINKASVKECIDNLNEIIKPFDIDVNWNIKTVNSLATKYKNYFDFVIANPPYIRIQHLLEDDRTFLQSNFKYCKKGATDIYYAFFEFALKSIKNDGKCAFITPNTFIFTETARTMRNDFSDKGYISKLVNYGEIQVFDDANTYSAITYFDKSKKDKFIYDKATSLTTFETIEIEYEHLIDQKIWRLAEQTNIKKSDTVLKDICDIYVGVSTLCDKAYVLEFIAENQNTMTLKSKLKGVVEIEKGIVKPCIKASKYKSSQDPITEYIIYPYDRTSGKAVIIDEQTMNDSYPLAYGYLKSVKDQLDKRDAGKPNPVIWYAFGRTQALDTTFGKKIIFSPMNKKPNFVYCDNEDAVFYSGYAIKYNGNYDDLLSKLNTVEMENYISISARDYRSAWKSYNKTVLMEFPV